MISSQASMSIGLVLSFAIGLSACSDSDGGDDASASWMASCMNICAKQEQCNSNTDEPDCVESCQLQSAGVSAGYANAASACFEAGSCNELLNGTTRDCIDDMVQSLAPTPKGKAFCADSAAKAEECNAATDEPAAVERCEEGIPAFSDALIEDLATCLDESCDQISGCVTEVGDAHRIDLSDLGNGPE